MPATMHPMSQSSLLRWSPDWQEIHQRAAVIRQSWSCQERHRRRELALRWQQRLLAAVGIR